MRKLSLWVLVAVVAAVAVAATATLPGLVVRVPDASDTLEVARSRLEDAGLRVEAVRRDGRGVEPLDAEGVVEQNPRAGRLVLRDSIVKLTTRPPIDDSVVMPDLLGRFESDARALLDELGLRQERPGLGDGRRVVVSQTPEPGSQVEFGTSVSYTASSMFPHTGENNDQLREVHGVLYLRYGLEGTKAACSGECHTEDTCTACHPQQAYKTLDSRHPNPK